MCFLHILFPLLVFFLAIFVLSHFLGSSDLPGVLGQTEGVSLSQYCASHFLLLLLSPFTASLDIVLGYNFLVSCMCTPRRFFPTNVGMCEIKSPRLSTNLVGNTRFYSESRR